MRDEKQTDLAGADVITALHAAWVDEDVQCRSEIVICSLMWGNPRVILNRLAS